MGWTGHDIGDGNSLMIRGSEDFFDGAFILTEDGQEIQLPGDVFMPLLLDSLRSRLIRMIEDIDVDELL